MARENLSTKFVQNAKTADGETRTDYNDSALPGFVLRVTAAGAKTFAVRYKVRGAGQPQQRYTIGPFPAVSLADARQRAKAILDAATGGVDLPAQEASQAEQERSAQETAAAHTVDSVADLYFADYSRTMMPNSIDSCRRELAYIREAWGTRPISSITATDAKSLAKCISADKPVQGNRVWGRIGAFLGWAADGDTPYIESSPVAGVRRKRLVSAMVLTTEQPRERYLSDDELRRLMVACDAMGYPAGWYIKTLIYTGQRRDEVRELPWSEIDEEAGDWTLPPVRNGKGKRHHLVPLPRQVRDILATVRKIQPPGREYVWTSNHKPKQPYSSTHECKKRIDSISGVTDWHLHDIRRTVRTNLSRLGVPDEIAERVINHAVGGQLGKIYNRWQFRDEKAEALQKWADFVDGLAY